MLVKDAPRPRSLYICAYFYYFRMQSVPECEKVVGKTAYDAVNFICVIVVRSARCFLAFGTIVISSDAIRAHTTYESFHFTRDS